MTISVAITNDRGTSISLDLSVDKATLAAAQELAARLSASCASAFNTEGATPKTGFLALALTAAALAVQLEDPKAAAEALQDASEALSQAASRLENMA